MTALTHHSLKLTTEQRNAIAAAGGKMGFRHLKNPMVGGRQFWGFKKRNDFARAEGEKK